MAVTEIRRTFNTIQNHLVRGMIIKVSLALSNSLQNLAWPQPYQPVCSLISKTESPAILPLCIVYIIPQHSTFFAYSNLNGPLLLPVFGLGRLQNLHQGFTFSRDIYNKTKFCIQGRNVRFSMGEVISFGTNTFSNIQLLLID